MYANNLHETFYLAKKNLQSEAWAWPRYAVDMKFMNLQQLLYISPCKRNEGLTRIVHLTREKLFPMIEKGDGIDTVPPTF